MQSDSICLLSKTKIFTNFICTYIMKKGENVETEVSNITYFLHFLYVLKGRKHMDTLEVIVTTKTMF